MPILDIRDGEIYYEVHGSGFPLMIFAPGGLRSELAFWRDSPSDPAVWMASMAVLGKKYRVLAMDQRKGELRAQPARRDDHQRKAVAVQLVIDLAVTDSEYRHPPSLGVVLQFSDRRMGE